MSDLALFYRSEYPNGVHLLLQGKDARAGGTVTIAIPAACPVKALYRWLEAAGVRESPVFRRIWQPPADSCKTLPAFAIRS